MKSAKVLKKCADNIDCNINQKEKIMFIGSGQYNPYNVGCNSGCPYNVGSKKDVGCPYNVSTGCPENVTTGCQQNIDKDVEAVQHTSEFKSKFEDSQQKLLNIVQNFRKEATEAARYDQDFSKYDAMKGKNFEDTFTVGGFEFTNWIKIDDIEVTKTRNEYSNGDKKNQTIVSLTYRTAGFANMPYKKV